MTVAIAVVAAKTSTGTQDIINNNTIPGGGLGGATPKAVLFLYSRAGADGTVTADAGSSFGFADATSQRAFASFAQNGAKNVGKVGKSDKCLCALKYSAGVVVHSEAAFVSFIPDGVRVDWTTAAPDGWLVTAVFFSGSAWTVAVGDSTAPLAGSVNTVGFQPDAVILGGVSDTIAGTIATNRGQATFGAAAFPGGVRKAIEQTTWAWGVTRQNVNTATGEFQGWSAYHWEVTGQYGVTVSRNATSFTLTGSQTSPTQKFGYLALKFTGGTLTTGKIALAEATGAQAFTGFGGAVSVFVLLLAQEQVLKPDFDWRFGISAHTNVNGGGFAVGSVTDGTMANGVHHSTANKDTVTLLAQDGSVNLSCTVASFDGDGITLNFTDAPDFDPARGVGFAGMEWGYLTVVNAAPVSAERVQAWIED